MVIIRQTSCAGHTTRPSTSLLKPGHQAEYFIWNHVIIFSVFERWSCSLEAMVIAIQLSLSS
jgi:hypothetical protein